MECKKSLKNWLIISNDNEENAQKYFGTEIDVREDFEKIGYKIININLEQKKIYIN